MKRFRSLRSLLCLGLIALPLAIAMTIGLRAQRRTSHTAHALYPAIRATPLHRGATDRILGGYGKRPVNFEPNVGQTDPRVKFLARKAGSILFLTKEGAVLVLHQKLVNQMRGPGQATAFGTFRPVRADSQHSRPTRQGTTDIIRMQLIGDNRNAKISGVDELPGKLNLLHGSNPNKWKPNLPTYAGVLYQSVYPRIDLIYHLNEHQLEYDFVVAPGGHARAISMSFPGALRVRVDRQTGDLVVKVEDQDIRLHKPVVYQTVSAGAFLARDVVTKHFVQARYIIDGDNHVRFGIGMYDHRRALIIDPILSYSTYLGGGGNDYGESITVDSAGNAYVTGYTGSLQFPVTSGVLQTTCADNCAGGDVDAYVTKLDPSGSALVYSTYLGGSANDYGYGIALDASGNAFVVGTTYSSDFPVTTGAFQTSCSGGSCASGSAFVAELNASGSALIYSTYIGGSGTTQGNAISLDSFDNAYVTGYTQSRNFPTTPNAFQPHCTSCSSASRAFVSKLNSSGSALIYSTYLGGTKTDIGVRATFGYAITLDSVNNAYVIGFTGSSDFPVTGGAFQTVLKAPTAAFVSKLNGKGSALVYSTFLGGSGSGTTPCAACGTGIVVDSSGNAYVCGLTWETNFPTTTGAVQPNFAGGNHDGFVTKLNPTGSQLVYSTYLGGMSDDGATAIAVDSVGNVYIRGNTFSKNFPTTPGAFQTALGGLSDAFVSILNASGSSLVYSTYLGGSGSEFGKANRSIALDSQSPPDFYVTGFTNSVNFPISVGALQVSSAGGYDAFIVKFAASPNVGLSPPSVKFRDRQIRTTRTP